MPNVGLSFSYENTVNFLEKDMFFFEPKFLLGFAFFLKADFGTIAVGKYLDSTLNKIILLTIGREG